MKSHLDIEIEARPGEGFKPLVLSDDFSISAEEPNPVFNDTSFFSYPCQVSTAQNMAVLKNIAHRDSAMRGMDLEHARARVVADGLPLNSGQVITSEDAEIGPTFDFNIDAQTESFSDLIGDLECQDVDISSKHIVIGEKIGEIEFEYEYTVEDYYYNSKTGQTATAPSDNEPYPHTRKKTASGVEKMDAPQALGFSFPGRTQGFPLAVKDESGTVRSRGGIEFYAPKVTESFINVWRPYPFPYCNTRVAYAHPDVKTNEDGTQETEGTVLGNTKGPEPEDYGQYWCLDADRQQSGICFYVLYFLDCLFEQLGVSWDKSELMCIEDFTRLCFVTTKCEYDSEEDDNKELKSLTEINDWLRSRNCGGQLSFSLEVPRPRKFDKPVEIYKGEELPKVYSTDANGRIAADDLYSTWPNKYDPNDPENPEGWDWYWDYHRKIDATFTVKSAKVNDMIANSKNFPKASVSSVISSLENMFGIRFLYNPETRQVTVCLFRNMYSEAAVKRFNGKVLSMTPLNEKITGVRVGYSAESEDKEQRVNIRDGIKDYDTDFDYIEYPDNRTIINLPYVQIARLVSSNNMNVYVDQLTGNSFRVKINADAEDSMTLRPTLFQVGQNKGVEIGDCSEKNKNYVRELVNEFIPVPMNVINAKDYNNDAEGNVAPILAPYLDVDMEHEYLKQEIQSVSYHDTLDVMKPIQPYRYGYGCAFPDGMQMLSTMRMWLSENYDPTQTESGNSPLQDIDWGLTIGVMRGPGTGYGYIVDDSGNTDEVIEISLFNFQSAMINAANRINYYLFNKTLAQIYAKMTELESDPNYGADYVMIEEIGYTISKFKQVIDQLYEYGFSPDLRYDYAESDIYYIIVGNTYGIKFYVINNKRTAEDDMRWWMDTTFGPTATGAENGVLHNRQWPNAEENLRQLLNSKTADGSWPENQVIYDKCQLTYGQLRDYFNQMSNLGFQRTSSGLWEYPAWWTQLESIVVVTGGNSSSGSSSATGSQIVNYDRGYDGFDNSKWRQTIGAYALTADSMDLKGATFDYNSNEEGTGAGERFSLQVCAYPQFVYYIDDDGKMHISRDMSLEGQTAEGSHAWAVPCANDERDMDGNITTKVRSRGYYDTFLVHHVYFLLHRKKYRVKALATIAQLLDIRNHWGSRYNLDGKIGFIDRLKYNITRAEGVRGVEMDFYAI